MKVSSLMAGILTSSVLILFPLVSNCYSQETYQIKHTQSGDAGRFTVTLMGEESSNKKLSVEEISLSVSGKTSKKIMVTADIIVETPPEVPTNFRAVVKSYADPDYEKKVEYKENESGNYDEVVDESKEESVPVKLYLEVNAGSDLLTYDFWDKSDLESTVSQINSQYGSNLQVTGEGRSVSVRNAAFVKKEEKKTINKRLQVSKEEIDDGSYTTILHFDVVKLEKELLSDKIIPKDRAGNFTLIVDPDEMYVNGNKISNKLLQKYRKIMNEFQFEFEEY